MLFAPLDRIIDSVETHGRKFVVLQAEKMIGGLAEPLLHDLHVRSSTTGILFKVFIANEILVSASNIFRYAVQMTGKGGHHRI